MKPRLFDKNANAFNTNGKGNLDFVSCFITEERNGIFELEGEITEQAYHASEIEMNSIIQAEVPDQQDLQLFRVYKLTKGINGRYMVYAQHISYQLSYIPTNPCTVTASASACATTLATLKSGAIETCPFTFTTDVTTVASFTLSKPASIRNCLGGSKGSVLDQFGGEYLWNNYAVSLLSHRGKLAVQKDVTLRYGKDIIDLNQEEAIANTVTGVVPYWVDTQGENIVMLQERVVESSYASAYPFKRTIPYDCSQDFQEAPSEEQLRTHAQAYVNQAGMGIPRVSIKVKFINLDEETATNLQRVKLCDVIGVEFVKLGISTTAKVVKYKYDVLNERYDSIEIGAMRGTLADTISETTGLLASLADDTRTMFKQNNHEIDTEIDNATAWLTSSDGYVMAKKDDNGVWKELFFLDRPDAEEAVNVLRINTNGIGFSSTGLGGPYTQAWTLDGKLVVGGTNVPSLTVYDSNNTVLFQISNAGMKWTAPNSSLDTYGTLTIKDGNNHVVGTWGTSGLTMYDGTGTAAANIIGKWGTSGINVYKGSLEGASVTVGGANNTNGQIHVKDASNNEVVTINNGGIDVKKGTITGSTVQSAVSGNRIVMDSSSTLKGKTGDTPHNWINMEQETTHNMIIDASAELDLCVNTLKVAEGSTAGAGGTAYTTRTDTTTAFDDQTMDTGRSCYRVLDVRKLMPADFTPQECQDMNLGEYQLSSPYGGTANITLPVFLRVRYMNERRLKGLVLDNGIAPSNIPHFDAM